MSVKINQLYQSICNIWTHLKWEISEFKYVRENCMLGISYSRIGITLSLVSEYLDILAIFDCQVFPDISEIQSSSWTIRQAKRHQERKYIILLPLVSPDQGHRLGRTHHIELSFSFSTSYTCDANTCEGETFLSLLPPPGLSSSLFFSSVFILWWPTGRKRDRWHVDVFMMPGAILQLWTLVSVRDDYIVNRRVSLCDY